MLFPPYSPKEYTNINIIYKKQAIVRQLFQKKSQHGKQNKEREGGI